MYIIYQIYNNSFILWNIILNIDELMISTLFNINDIVSIFDFNITK